MKFYKSTSSRSYSVNGLVIPANNNPHWLTVSNDKATELERVAVVKGLIKAGSILVTDKEPAELARTPGKLLNTNNQLATENATLKAEIEKLKAEKDAVLQGNEAAQALEAAQKEAEDLKHQLEEQQKQYDALKAEAEETIASLKKKKVNNNA